MPRRVAAPDQQSVCIHALVPKALWDRITATACDRSVAAGTWVPYSEIVREALAEYVEKRGK